MDNVTTVAPETTEVAATPLFMSRDQAIALLTEKGLEYTEQSGFLKVIAPGGRLYIAATKTVRRVDLSGFEVGLGTLTKVPHCGVFGQVKQQLKLGTSDSEALANLTAVIDHLMALPAPAPKVKAPKAPKAAKDEKKGWGAVPAAPAPETDDAKAARIALIKKVAQEKGMAVSSKSIATASE